ncbi:hypothetical protein BH10BAC5_BH10BAC5_09830 [soil metagenome]
MQTKEEIESKVQSELEDSNLNVVSKDFQRPWGGFFRIADDNIDKFTQKYYKDIDLPDSVSKLNVSPKILVVAPDKRLSWQVHERRSEIWRVVKGPIGVYQSKTDEQHEMDTYQNDDIIQLPQGTRHRLVGLDNWGVVAEIWVHTDPNNPSDEDDIRRIQDDFGR